VELASALERVTFCNCSICSRSGYLHCYVEPARFRLLTPLHAIATYQFGTGRAKHHFCRRCGVSPFRRPGSDPHLYDVNARCLEGLVLDDLAVDLFDGRRWEEAEAAGQLDPLRGDE
jgi:hypothetical protein